MHEIDGNLGGGAGRTLGGAGLQDPKPAVLDRELDALHIGEIALKLLEISGEARPRLAAPPTLRSLGQRAGAPRHHIFALRLEQNVDHGIGAPVEGSREKATPEAGLVPRLPNTMA